jgi:hypothetical protein
VGSDGSFWQVDDDEQIRIDDVCLHGRKERVRHLDSLPATFVDGCVRLVGVVARVSSKRSSYLLIVIEGVSSGTRSVSIAARHTGCDAQSVEDASTGQTCKYE